MVTATASAAAAAAAAAAAEYGTPTFSGSPSMSTARSPDTTSPVYPDRAIRPLPKSRLKNKLSPEQSASIVYPPEPPPISPTLHFSTIHENGIVPHPPLINGGASDYHSHADMVTHGHCTCGEDGDSGDEEVEFDHPDYRYTTAAMAPVNGGKPLDTVQRRLLEASRVPLKPPPPGSTGSSADGYESFENTSNKKKRKIPLPSASGVHTSLSAGMANMGIHATDGTGDDVHAGGAVGSHYSYSASGTGISGAGRGRYGRQNARHERKPLASTMNAVNGYNSRLPRNNGEGKSLEAGIENTGGIISQAIKTAAEQGPLSPQKGHEYGSLLQSATNSATPKTQFTFAVKSESATKMADQQAAAAAAAAAGYGPRHALPGAYAAGRGPASRSSHTQGTQTTPQLRQGQAAHQNDTRPPPQTGSHPASQQQSAPAPEPKPKPRRRPSKEYALAARQRRLQQEYTNYHHRPTPGNMYICEFCEYEDIFGVPPLAMIRRYEIKDREERKKAAERRRLLEKAKAKNRKGKKGKGGKNNVNNPPPLPGNGGAAAYDPNMPPGPDGEDYYDEDEYGDEYDPVDGDFYDDGVGDRAYPPPSTRSGIQPPAPTPTAGSNAVTGRPPPPPPGQPA